MIIKGNDITNISIQETRLLYKQWEDYQNLNALLLDEITSMRERDPKGLMGSNPGCWRTHEKYKCEQELLKPMNMIIAAWTDYFIPNAQVDIEIGYWTNVNEPGSENVFHAHYMDRADVSGVYYVQGSNTGAIRFTTHEQMYKMIITGQDNIAVAREPQDGEIMLFPSYLLHAVVANPHPTRQRISIAFNAKIRIKEGKNDKTRAN